MSSKNNDKEIEEPLELDESENSEVPATAASLSEVAAAVTEMRRELRKSLAWSQIIHQQNKRIQHRLTMMTLGNYIRLLILLSPLIIAAIYLPPILRRAVEFYDTVMTTTTNAIPTRSLETVRQWLQSASPSPTSSPEKK